VDISQFYIKYIYDSSNDAENCLKRFHSPTTSLSTMRSKIPIFLHSKLYNYWNNGLNSGILTVLRRAHVAIFMVDYENFRSQLFGFSSISKDFDWAPVIFTQDVHRKKYKMLLWKYFFTKNQKSVTHAELYYAWIYTYSVTEFSKTFLVFYKWPDLHADVGFVLTRTVPRCTSRDTENPRRTIKF
jgi:hypothetical protein